MTVLIVTTENSGIDRYSQELAKRLPVPVVTTRRYLNEQEAQNLEEKIIALDDVVHLPHQHFARFAVKRKKPYLVTVHDITRLCLNFDQETPKERGGLSKDIEGIKRADKIISVSVATKNDLINYLGLPSEQIIVIYNGVNHNVFYPRSRKPVDEPYIFYAGSERPRKNLIRLVEAFKAVKAKFPDLKMVKSGSYGREHSFRGQLYRHITKLGLQKDIIFTGHLKDEELAWYYSGALAFVYPSLYEGFGLPVVEAMACGCPVITSNVSSLPEVAGGAAIVVDPYDVQALAQAIANLLSNRLLAKELRHKGLARAKDFSWEKTAEQTESVYHQIRH